MADTMFAVHTPMMKAALGDIVKEHPWTYAVMLLLISKFVNSQAAAISAFVPLALGIGVEPGVIVALRLLVMGIIFYQLIQAIWLLYNLIDQVLLTSVNCYQS